MKRNEEKRNRKNKDELHTCLNINVLFLIKRTIISEVFSKTFPKFFHFF